MARATKKDVVVRPSSTAMATIDAELSNEAANIKATLAQSGSNRIKAEVVGSWTAPDGRDLGPDIQVVVVDYVNRNNFYATQYNPNALTPPDCYAVGKDLATMTPSDPAIPDRQADSCAVCPQNQWNSGQGGKGKACSNRVLLAVLLVDPEMPDAHNAPNAPLCLIDLPPTALQSWTGTAGYIANMLKGPPIKAIITLNAVNAGTYAKITVREPLSNPDYAVHATRRAEAADLLNRKPDYAAAAAAPKGRAPAKRNAAPARR